MVGSVGEEKLKKKLVTFNVKQHITCPSEWVSSFTAKPPTVLIPTQNTLGGREPLTEQRHYVEAQRCQTIHGKDKRFHFEPRIKNNH